MHDTNKITLFLVLVATVACGLVSAVRVDCTGIKYPNSEKCQNGDLVSRPSADDLGAQFNWKCICWDNTTHGHWTGRTCDICERGMKFSKGCTESRRTGEDTEFFWFAVSSGCSLMIFTVIMLLISFTEECFKSSKIEKEMARIASRTDTERRAALGLPGVATDEQCAEEENAKRRRDLGVDAGASDALCKRAEFLKRRKDLGLDAAASDRECASKERAITIKTLGLPGDTPNAVLERAEAADVRKTLGLPAEATDVDCERVKDRVVVWGAGKPPPSSPSPRAEP